MGPFHAIKQDVLLKILDIVSAHGAEMAFPTQTLHLPGLEGGLPQGAPRAPASADAAAPR